ncbi:NAD-dependent succinate-semialdehyde dehydrogenase [Salicibibacter kimchii]|uniref:NAD-dependent succinate-semialdehyde dehydrogenase n=1 Tax=Salicibibacter kimchii TaxID=2099786 RepID=A0A345BW70_9BACI|nr:NAD-dependent succinate-semialdehyde dehydrogenase [Salicibibacter kimchii]AXF55201.1 NAD-dependent succinate-semialdehyde dehydrogenase [Salicibibacter kimchii]
MYINGEWIQTNNVLEVSNPATSELVDEVFLVDKTQTEYAIKAAKKAISGWSATTAEKRAVYLNLVAEKLEERKSYFANIITKEMGKSIHNALYEVQAAANFFRWYAEEGRRVYGNTIPTSDNQKRISTIKQPVGVIGAITPWNFPLYMIARKFAPALAAGCTLILKPAPEAPLSSVELFKVFEEVGIPQGVVNLVLGEATEVASALMESHDVKKITFTGSTEVGKILMRQSADTVKKISMELGGHAPFIIFPDADVDLAVEGLVKSKFASTGQQCVSPNRIYVEESIYEIFAERLKDRVSLLKVGNGLDEANDIGAMISEDGLHKTHEHVKDAINKGANLVYGGSRLEDGEHANGYFYSPTVLTDTEEGMKILTEETFGPVIPLIRFSSEDEVIQKANETNYGLASYFYTKDLGRMHRVSEKLEFGIVGVNDPAPFVVQAPFGGVKESGIGKEGGFQGIEEYLETKYVSVLINGSTS